VDRDSGQLVVYSAEETDAGQWECVASNELGEDSTVAQLTLIGQTQLSVIVSSTTRSQAVAVSQQII